MTGELRRLVLLSLGLHQLFLVLQKGKLREGLRLLIRLEGIDLIITSFEFVFYVQKIVLNLNQM